MKIRLLLLSVLFAFYLAVPVYAQCDHEFVEMREEPTCEDGGITWLECIHCGFSKDYQYLDPIDHDFGH